MPPALAGHVGTRAHERADAVEGRPLADDGEGVGGKARRQAGEDTQISTDTPADLSRMRAAVDGRLLCRINGYGAWTAAEVEAVDTVSSATLTSNALKAAVLSEAKKQKKPKKSNGGDKPPGGSEKQAGGNEKQL